MGGLFSSAILSFPPTILFAVPSGPRTPTLRDAPDTVPLPGAAVLAVPQSFRPALGDAATFSMPALPAEGFNCLVTATGPKGQNRWKNGCVMARFAVADVMFESPSCEGVGWGFGGLQHGVGGPAMVAYTD